MKKAILVAAALVASAAQASSSLEFGDLNYFLKANQFNLRSDFSVVDSEVDPETSARVETSGYVLENRFGYGIADNLNAFVGLDFAFMYENKLKGASDSDGGGLSNPYIGATYRLMNQENSAFNLDLGVLGRIRLMDAEVGLGNEDGTFNRGNHSLEANVAIGRKWNEANEWRVTASAIQNFEGEFEDKNRNEDVTTTASTDFSLTAAYQYRPVQEFMMAVSAQALRVGESDFEYDAGDATDDAHLDFNFRFTAKYLITEKFIAKFNYGQSRLEEYDRGDVEQKERQSLYYGFGIDWLF